MIIFIRHIHLALVISLLSVGALGVESTPSKLVFYKSGDKSFVDYYPSPSANGLAMLFYGNDIKELMSSQEIFAFNIQRNPKGKMTFEVTEYAKEQRGFFTVREFPLATYQEYLEADNPNVAHLDEEPEKEKIIYVANGPVDDLRANELIEFDLKLLSSTTGEIVPENRVVKFVILDEYRNEVTFEYKIEPDILTISNGVAYAKIIIHTVSDLEHARIGVVGIQNKSARSDLQPPSNVNREYDLESYRHRSEAWSPPLQARFPIAGNFGEHRPKQKLSDPIGGRGHEGIDFAAPVGTDIFAAKKGILYKIEDAFDDTKYINIEHGDGTVTTYMHIVPKYELLGKPVAAGQLIGSVGRRKGGNNHLHFELREVVGNYLNLGKQPGKTLNPASFNESFSPLLITSENDSGSPIIDFTYFTAKDPRESMPINDGYISNETGRYLVARIRDTSSPSGGYALIPHSISFSFPTPKGNGNYTVKEYSFANKADIDKFIPANSSDSAEAGYCAYFPKVMTKDRQYLIWFDWDSKMYFEDRSGPVSLKISASDSRGMSDSLDLKLGPELTISGDQPASANSSVYCRVSVECFLGPFHSKMSGVMNDEVKISILQLPGNQRNSWFHGSGSTEKTLLFSSDGSTPKSYIDIAAVTRQIPGENPGGPPVPNKNILLRAESTKFPGLGHDLIVNFPDT